MKRLYEIQGRYRLKSIIRTTTIKIPQQAIKKQNFDTKVIKQHSLL